MPALSAPAAAARMRIEKIRDFPTVLSDKSVARASRMGLRTPRWNPAA